MVPVEGTARGENCEVFARSDRLGVRARVDEEPALVILNHDQDAPADVEPSDVAGPRPDARGGPRVVPSRPGEDQVGRHVARQVNLAKDALVPAVASCQEKASGRAPDQLIDLSRDRRATHQQADLAVGRRSWNAPRGRLDVLGRPDGVPQGESALIEECRALGQKWRERARAEGANAALDHDLDEAVALEVLEDLVEVAARDTSHFGERARAQRGVLEEGEVHSDLALVQAWGREDAKESLVGLQAAALGSFQGSLLSIFWPARRCCLSGVPCGAPATARARPHRRRMSPPE